MINNKKLYAEAKSNPVSFWDYEPTTFDSIKNGVGSLLSGAYVGMVAKPSEMLGGMAVFTMEQIDALGGMEEDSLETRYLKNQLAATVKQTQLIQETAQNAGHLSSTVFSIGDVISSFIGAGKFAKGAGATATSAGAVQGYADYEQGLAEGIDPYTAAQKGAITGGSIALGGYVPMSMGFKLNPFLKTGARAESAITRKLMYGELLAKDVAYTSGANIAIGAGQRGFSHEVLKANGYEQMATQYQALDESAMIIDAALGFIFGGAAKYAELRQQSIVDALLARNNQIHQNVDAAPGIATDVASLDKHNAAFNKALEDTIQGKPVDVAHILQDSNFAIKSDVDWHNKVIEAVTKQYPNEALYYSKSGVAVPAKVIADIKHEILSKNNLSKQDKKDLVKINNGEIPKHLVSKVVEKTGLKPSEISDTFSVYKNQETAVSDAEFKRMQDSIAQGEIPPGDVVSGIMQDKPDMQIRHVDDNGVESLVRADDLMKQANDEVALAQSDKKLAQAAVNCMLRNA